MSSWVKCYQWTSGALSQHRNSGNRISREPQAQAVLSSVLLAGETLRVGSVQIWPWGQTPPCLPLCVCLQAHVSVSVCRLCMYTCLYLPLCVCVGGVCLVCVHLATITAAAWLVFSIAAFTWNEYTMSYLPKAPNIFLKLFKLPLPSCLPGFRTQTSHLVCVLQIGLVYHSEGSLTI